MAVRKQIGKNDKGIYEFDPTVYPIRLWVCKEPSVENVEKFFYPLNSDGEVVDSFGDCLNGDGMYANVVIVRSKESGLSGCLVSLFRPKQSGAGVCAHEALHFVAYVGEQFGIDLGGFDGSEPLAYLEQWATTCIWSVLVNKAEQMKGVLLETK